MRTLLIFLAICGSAGAATINPFRVDHPQFPDEFVQRKKIEGLRHFRKTGLLPEDKFWQWARWKRESSPTLRNGELRFDHFHCDLLVHMLIKDGERRSPIEIPEVPDVPPIEVPIEPPFEPCEPPTVIPPVPPIVPNNPVEPPNVIPEPPSISLLAIPIVLVFLWMVWRSK